MFDDHRVNITNPEKIFHEEKRAPTDKSIELSEQYEQKILNKILDQIIVFDNFFEYTVVFTDEILTRRMHLKIKINQTEYRESFNAKYTVDEIVDDIIKWISSKFYKDILNSLCQEFMSPKNMGYRTFSVSNIKQDEKK